MSVFAEKPLGGMKPWQVKQWCACEGKKKRMEEQAKSAAAQISKEGKSHMRRISAYKCPRCGFWHLGHSRRQRK